MSVRITSNGHDNEKRIEWKILHFFHFFQNIDYVIDSPSFSIFNTRFHLRLEIEYKPIGYVCMYMCHLSKFEYKAEYVMGIKNVDGSEVKTEKLEFLISKPGGTPSLELIPLMELSNSKELMVPGDCLTVFCNICRIEMPIYSFPKISSSNSSLNCLLISLLKNKDIEKLKSIDFLSPNTSLHDGKDIEELNTEYFLSSNTSLHEEKDIEELNAEDFLSSNTALRDVKVIIEINAEDILSSHTSLHEVKDVEELNAEDFLSSIASLNEVKDIEEINEDFLSSNTTLHEVKDIEETNSEDYLSSNTDLHEVKDIEEINEDFLSSNTALHEVKDIEEINSEDYLSSNTVLHEVKDVEELNAEDFLSSIASLNKVKDIEEINEDILSSNTALHEVKVIEELDSEDFQSSDRAQNEVEVIEEQNADDSLSSNTDLHEAEDIEEQNADDSLSSNTALHEVEDIEELNAGDFLSSNTSLHEVKGIGDSQDSYVNDAISVLTENLKDLYLKKRYTDITIKVQNKEFHAHKLILNARLRYFASMFHHDSFERRTGIVEITDCDPDSFSDFLLFLYTADLNIVSSENVFELYKTADKYGCKELMKECVRFMIQQLSSDTFCDYFYLATMHNEFKLLTASINYFIKNAKTIFLTTKWLILLEEHPTLCNELLIKFTNVL